jgi:hypothetical protein
LTSILSGIEHFAADVRADPVELIKTTLAKIFHKSEEGTIAIPEIEGLLNDTHILAAEDITIFITEVLTSHLPGYPC